MHDSRNGDHTAFGGLLSDGAGAAGLCLESNHRCRHITGGTTDNPGVDLVFGYKASDIALVPVAVAKHCPDAQCGCMYHRHLQDAGHCRDQERQITAVRTFNCRLQKAEYAVAEASNRVLELQNQKTNLQTQNRIDYGATEYAAKRKPLRHHLPSMVKTGRQDWPISTRRLMHSRPLSETAALTKEIDTKESEIITATGTLDSAKISLANLKAQLRSEVSADRGTRFQSTEHSAAPATHSRAKVAAAAELAAKRFSPPASRRRICPIIVAPPTA